MIQHPRFDTIDIADSIYCSIDPVTITALAIGGISAIAGGAIASGASSGGSQAPAPMPTAPPPQAPAQQQPGDKPKPKSNTPSFIGASGVPSNQSFGSKTLLGQ
jgi:hypothetical protein